jgi:hypothetical protein
MDKVRNTRNDVDELKGMFGGNKKSSKTNSENNETNTSGTNSSRNNSNVNNTNTNKTGGTQKSKTETSVGGPVKHHTELVNLLPNISIDGYTRRAPNGNTTKMNTTDENGETIEFAMSNAEVTYESEDGKSITAVIMDYTQNGMYLGILCLNADMNFSVDNMDGYSKSITYRGFKGFETANYDRENNGQYPECSMFLCVKERYYVSVSARGSKDLNLVKNLIDKIDFSKLN